MQFATCTAVAIVVSWAFHGVSAEAQTSPAAKPLKVSGIRVERAASEKLDHESASPLLVSGRIPLHEEIEDEFSQIIAGRGVLGAQAVYGYLGRGYPASGEIVAERFERRGEVFRLEFRYREAKETPGMQVADGWTGYFLAPLPADVPDGTYRIVVKVHDLPAGATGRPATETTFTKPDEPTKTRAAELAAFEKLPLKSWVDRYRAVADGLPDSAAPTESWNWYELSRDTQFAQERTILDAMKRRIIARKFEISPFLIEALKQECIRNAGAAYGASPRGNTGELLQMVLAIGDARASPVLLDIVSGRLNCSFNVRKTALVALELLTCVRFRMSGSVDSVPMPGAVAAPQSSSTNQEFAFQQSLVPSYESWLAAHPAAGPDRSPWLKAAAKQARAWLASDNIQAAYEAAEYLRGDDEAGLPRDDDPDRTTDLIATQIHKFVPDPISGEQEFPEYRYAATRQPIPAAMGNWTSLLIGAGPLHPRHLSLLARLERDTSNVDGAFADMFCSIGGREAMELRCERYRKAVAAVVALGIDPQRMSIWNDSPEQVLRALLLMRYLRFGIERWAGRLFETEQQLQAWLEAEKDRSQEQWLQSGLPILAAQADAGNARAQLLLRVILEGSLPDRPDSPKLWRYVYSVEWLFMPGGMDLDPEEMPPFRAKWLADNRSRLQCDPERFRIRLASPTNQPK